jgi:hypothetical protein
MHAFTRRLGAAVIGIALATGTALVAAPAQAATNHYSLSSGDWLARQLTHGLVHNDQYDFDDRGLSLDVLLALQEIGARPAARTSIIDAFAADPEAYISAYGTRTAGGTGKLATAVGLEGGNPRAFGGVDLIARITSLLSTRRGEVGRGVDSGSGEYSNTIGQAWIVRALTAANAAKKSDATRFLLQQQCAAGYFRLTLESATATSAYTCDRAASADRSPSVDATALALQALEVAQAGGVPGLGDDIADAAGWLVRRQGATGFFSDQGTANSNSTGLAASALATAGRPGPAGNAAAWLLAQQVTDSMASRHPALSGDSGALAFNSTALAAAKKDGITAETQDQFRRATAQAAPGLNALLPATTLRVTAPSTYQHGGSTRTVTTTGLRAGERFTTRLGTARKVRGVADSTGTATARLRLPRATRNYIVTTTGSRAVRAGTSRLKVLGATTLTQTLTHRTVAKASPDTVTIRGLARGERVRLNYRGTRIWNGYASRTGTAVHKFNVGRTAGKQRLTARGRFDDRISSTYLTVR